MHHIDIIGYTTCGARPVVMSEDVFQAIIADITAPNLIHIRGGVDPLTHPDVWRFVTLAKDAGLTVFLNSPCQVPALEFLGVIKDNVGRFGVMLNSLDPEVCRTTLGNEPKAALDMITALLGVGYAGVSVYITEYGQEVQPLVEWCIKRGVAVYRKYSGVPPSITGGGALEPFVCRYVDPSSREDFTYISPDGLDFPCPNMVNHALYQGEALIAKDLAIGRIPATCISCNEVHRK